MLVPEIALTPQIVGRFIERFGETVAVLHSRMTPGQRYAEWRRLREGEARVCVGPRSAVFAPIEDLGLIVVDEEHDSSYKHEGDPRYDARDVAAERAERLWRGAAAGQRHTAPGERAAAARVLPAPAGGRAAAARRAGARHARRDAGAASRSPRRRSRRCAPRARRRSCCSTAAAGRTSSRAAPAGACGAVRTATSRSYCTALADTSPATTAATASGCPRAAVTAPPPSVARHGAGTERLEHDLASVFDDGHFPVFRLDADVVAEDEQDGVGALLRRFEAADCGVLIGTQMVAKGHDFPDVTLGVVLDADATLRFPDFRAEERTFALIAQLAGRAGRGGHGRVLVQTIAPEARAIVLRRPP